jgi:hypothetical protein
MISVTLSAGTAQVAGTQSTLTSDNRNATLNLKANGKPDCAVNPAINKNGTMFSNQPPGCSGSACNAVKALVLALDNTDVIPDGAVLYTCNVNIAATASGTVPASQEPWCSMARSASQAVRSSERWPETHGRVP